jgi:outer membrane protein TolC
MRGYTTGSWAALVVAALAFVAGGAGGQTTVELRDAVDRALARSPQLAQAENALLNAETTRKTAKGSFLPTVSTSAGATIQSSSQFDPTLGQLESSTSNSTRASISANYSLFEGGQRFYDLQRSEADVGAASARLENQRYQVIFQTKGLFFAALATGDLLRVARAREDRAQQGLEIVERQVQLGSGTRSDLLRAQLELANSRQGVLQAEASDRAARFALGRQIGLGEPVSPSVPDGIGPRPLPLGEEEVFVLAEEASPSVEAAALAVESADAGIKSSRTSYIPSVGMSGGYGWNNGEWALADGRTSWSVSFNASYPIFQGFTRSVGVQRARESYRVAQLQEVDARLAARQEADRALQGLRTAEQAIAIALESVTVAEEDLRVITERYRVGVGIILDVLASQIALTEAEAGLVQARFDYEIAWADLESILGREL